MPWYANSVPDPESAEIDTDMVNPPPIVGDEHSWVANVAFSLTKEEVINSFESDTVADPKPPRLTPDKVIAITIACGRCLARADDDSILVINEPCPGRPS